MVKMVVALALLSVLIFMALLYRSRGRSEAFTPVVLLTARKDAYADSKAEWDQLNAEFAGPSVEFRVVLLEDDVRPLVPPPVPPGQRTSDLGQALASPLKPPAPHLTSAPKFDERTLVPPANPASFSSDSRVEILVNDVVKARYPGAAPTATNLDQWIRATLSSQEGPSEPAPETSG